MRERKKTAVHGTLEMTYRAVKFNFQKVLLKTLISRMNALKDMAVLNIIKTDGKCAPEAKREDLELIQLLNFEQIENIIGRSFLAEWT